MISKEAFSKVLLIISEVFKVPKSHIVSRSRKEKIIKARHVLYKVMNVLGSNMSEIGRYLSRDHTTVAHGIEIFHNLYELDEDFRKKADLVIKNLIKTKYEEEST